MFDRVGSFACRRTLQARHGEGGWAKMRNHGVAHRTLACGTRLGICNLRTSQCTIAYVVDRGPWGALDRKGEWHLRTTPLRSGEHYRGDLDLLPGTYTAIALVGIEKVAYWPLPSSEPGRPPQGNHLPPLRAGGRSPFAINLRPAAAGEIAPQRAVESTISAPLALNVAMAPVAALAFPPLDTSDELATLPRRPAVLSRRR